jgi:ribosomal protein S18 acetylase RimI-like enzyme
LQNHRIGQRLVAAGERELEDRGFRWAEIAVNENAPRAESLYLRLGYKPTAVVSEEYSYRSPSGTLVRVPMELRLLRKQLDFDRAGTSAQA